MERVVVLGSTGSIGTQTLKLIAEHQSQYQIYALVAKSNITLLYEQCQLFHPQYVVLADEKAALKLQQQLTQAGLSTQVYTGTAMMEQVVAESAVDIVVAAIVGAAGLAASFAAVKAGKKVILANKEALVMAGDLFMQAVNDSNAILLPMDSEHNAIFQVMPAGFLPGRSLPSCVESIILTASGGPFLTRPLHQYASITPAEAVAHPNWEMGAKISVDSATMMNKVLEVIEAHYLFQAPAGQIKVWIHPQSIIHSLVSYTDGSTLAQMGLPDMLTPLAHCFGWPERIERKAAPLNLVDCHDLTFMKVDKERFPCFKYAGLSLGASPSYITALNAVNEIAVAAFLAEQLSFQQIDELIDRVMQAHAACQLDSIASIMAVDTITRRQAVEIVRSAVLVQ